MYDRAAQTCFIIFSFEQIFSTEIAKLQHAIWRFQIIIAFLLLDYYYQCFFPLRECAHGCQIGSIKFNTGQKMHSFKKNNKYKIWQPQA